MFFRRVWALLQLIALAAFLIGFFGKNESLLLFGGILVVLEDIGAIYYGVLKLPFPIILAGVLAIIINPWYVGVFWASAVFKLLDIPTNIGKLGGN